MLDPLWPVLIDLDVWTAAASGLPVIQMITTGITSVYGVHLHR